MEQIHFIVHLAQSVRFYQYVMVGVQLSESKMNMKDIAMKLVHFKNMQWKII